MSIKSDLNDAISEAHLALEEIDNFGLHSEDAKNNKKFYQLNKTHEKAVGKVMKLAAQLQSAKTRGDNEHC